MGFMQYLDDLIIQDVGSSPETILEYFNSKDCDFGIGTERYKKDISWFVADMVDDGDYSIQFKL